MIHVKKKITNKDKRYLIDKKHYPCLYKYLNLVITIAHENIKRTDK